MTESDYRFLSSLFKKAKELRKQIQDCPGNHPDYIKLREEFDDLDVVSELISNTSQKIKGNLRKIEKIRHVVQVQTNGVVTLNDDTITKIIEVAIV